MSCNRCTGQCCKAFTLSPGSPEEVHKVLMGNINIDSNSILGKDSKMTLEMVRYIGFYSNVELRSIAGIDLKDRDNEKKWHFYTCIHHNKETGDCMNYENRPGFCRSFPNERECYYSGCSLNKEEQLNQKDTRIQINKAS